MFDRRVPGGTVWVGCRSTGDDGRLARDADRRLGFPHLRQGLDAGVRGPGNREQQACRQSHRRRIRGFRHLRVGAVRSSDGWARLHARCRLATHTVPTAGSVRRRSGWGGATTTPLSRELTSLRRSLVGPVWTTSTAAEPPTWWTVAPSHDTLRGNEGNDTIKGSGDSDWLNGDDGDDLLKGGPGNDSISGAAASIDSMAAAAGTISAATATRGRPTRSSAAAAAPSRT